MTGGIIMWWEGRGNISYMYQCTYFSTSFVSEIFTMSSKTEDEMNQPMTLQYQVNTMQILTKIFLLDGESGLRNILTISGFCTNPEELDLCVNGVKGLIALQASGGGRI